MHEGNPILGYKSSCADFLKQSEYETIVLHMLKNPDKTNRD